MDRRLGRRGGHRHIMRERRRSRAISPNQETWRPVGAYDRRTAGTQEGSGAAARQGGPPWPRRPSPTARTSRRRGQHSQHPSARRSGSAPTGRPRVSPHPDADQVDRDLLPAGAPQRADGGVHPEAGLQLAQPEPRPVPGVGVGDRLSLRPRRMGGAPRDPRVGTGADGCSHGPGTRVTPARGRWGPAPTGSCSRSTPTTARGASAAGGPARRAALQGPLGRPGVGATRADR